MLHLSLAVESVDRRGLHFSIQRLLMTLPLSAQWIRQFQQLVSRFMIPFFKVILRNDPLNDPKKRRNRGKRKRKSASQ